MHEADDPEPPEHDELLTVSSVADRLGLKSLRVYELIHAQELPAAKERGQWRIGRRALDAWMSKNRWPVDNWRLPEWPAQLEPVSVRFADIEAPVLDLMDRSLAFSLRFCMPIAVVEGKLVVGFARPPKSWELGTVADACRLPIVLARVAPTELERALDDWDASIIEPEEDAKGVDAQYTEMHRRFEEERGLPPLEALMFSRFFELRVWERHSQGLRGVRLMRDHESGPFSAEYFFDEADAGEGCGSFAPTEGWEAVWPRLKDGGGIAELPAEENVNPRHFYLGGSQPYVQVLLNGQIQRREYAHPDGRRTPSARRVQLILEELRRALRDAGTPFRL